MSRIKNLVSGVSSGYLAMGANIVYTMGSIPVALHYLSKEQFGLWALITQLAGYLTLLDLGMTSAAARILIDYKDNRDGGRYGSVVLTSGLVFAIQGAIITVCGCLMSPLVASAVHIPAQFVGLFRMLFAFQCILLGLGFLGRIFGGPLSAHQRYDISNLSQATQLLMSFAALWIGFSLQWGLYSMVFSGVVGFLWSILFQGVAVVRMGFFPKRGCWGRVDSGIFRELFDYGKDIFLMGLGWQLMSASQVVIISRVMGLDAAATWSICTKIFNLAQQFVWRIYDFSCGAFCEMLVRGENDRLKKRFRDTLVITASLSVFVATLCALCNGPFVALWTHGRISWNPLNDALLGILLIVYSVNRCHGVFVAVTKKIGFGRYVYFFEGAIFVTTAFFASGKWGFPGIIACAILSDILLPGVYGLWRSKRFFGCSRREMIFGWLRSPGLFAISFLIPAYTLSAFFGNPGEYSFFIRGGLLATVGLPLLWFVGIPREIRLEIRAKLAAFLSRKAQGQTNKVHIAVKG